MKSLITSKVFYTVLLLLSTFGSFMQAQQDQQQQVQHFLVDGKIQALPVSYAINLLSFNSKANDFSPVYFKDGIVFCSTRHAPLWSGIRAGRGDMALYYAEKKGNFSYKIPTKLKGVVNSRTDEGPSSFTTNRQKILFTKPQKQTIKRKRALPKLGIYLADLTKGKVWKNIQKFPYNDPSYNLLHPSLSADGKKLYFASDIPGGYGGTDIYVCESKENGHWSAPINLGPIVNTVGNELFPFIHQNGTLFFSSNGYSGLGGLDIWYTLPLNDYLWMKPESLGQPINSSKDDFGIVMTEDGKTGYFSSNRRGSKNGDDIYAFNAYFEKIQNREDLANALILNPIIGMEKLPFANNDWRITQKIAKELDKVVSYLELNPGVEIEIESHTNAKGDDNANWQLSKKRAVASSQYIIARGITNKRVSHFGYGEKKLLNDCNNDADCDDMLHEVNNRIEIRLRRANAQSLLAYVRKQDTPKAHLQSQPMNSHLYELQIGPYPKVDNRLVHECKQISTDLDIRYSPNGASMVLGPYDSKNLADQHQVKIQRLGIQKARVVSHQAFMVDQATTSNKPKGYAVKIGPYKTLTDFNYSQFLNLGKNVLAKNSAKGIYLFLGWFDKESDAKKMKQRAIVIGAKKPKVVDELD